MRFLILNTDYPEFLRSYYALHPDLQTRSHDEQMRIRNESFFGLADAFSSNFVDAATRHGKSMSITSSCKRPGRGSTGSVWVPAVVERNSATAASLSVAASRRQLAHWTSSRQQIAHYHPDVVLNQAIEGISAEFLQERKSHVRLLVGPARVAAARRPAN